VGDVGSLRLQGNDITPPRQRNLLA